MTALLTTALLVILFLFLLFGLGWYWLAVGALVLAIVAGMVYVSSRP